MLFGLIFSSNCCMALQFLQINVDIDVQDFKDVSKQLWYYFTKMINWNIIGSKQMLFKIL